MTERPTLKIYPDGTVHDSHGCYDKAMKWYTVPVSGTYAHCLKSAQGDRRVHAHYSAGMKMSILPNTLSVEYIGPMPQSDALKTQTFEGKEHTNYIYNTADGRYTVPLSGMWRRVFKTGASSTAPHSAGEQITLGPDTVSFERVGPMPQDKEPTCTIDEVPREAGNSEAKIKALQDLVEAQAALIRVLLKTPGYPPKS